MNVGMMKMQKLFVAVTVALLWFTGCSNDRQKRSASLLPPALKSDFFTAEGKLIAYSTWRYRLALFKTDADRLLSILKSHGINARLKSYWRYYDMLDVLFDRNETERLRRWLKPYARRVKVGKYAYDNFVIEPFKEARHYPDGALFMPVLGLTRVKSYDKYLVAYGVTGLEKADESRGKKVATTLRYETQRKLIKKIDALCASYGASWAAGIVVNEYSGAILGAGTTMRFDPSHLTRRDIARMKTAINFYLFDAEPFWETLKHRTPQRLRDLIEAYAANVRYEQKSSDLPLERTKKGKFTFIKLVETALPFYNGGYRVMPHFLQSSAKPPVKMGRLPEVEIFPLRIRVEELDGEMLFIAESFENARLFAMIFIPNDNPHSISKGGLR
jgi:hypothetical protein